MRRPTFDRWIKREVMRISKSETFNFHKLAAQAQRPNAPDRLAAALLLAFILAAQRLRLAVARLLPFSAMDILRDAVWTVPLSAAIAAFAFRILSRIDLIAENVVPGKGGDSQ